MKWLDIQEKYKVGDYICRKISGCSNNWYFFNIDGNFPTVVPKNFLDNYNKNNNIIDKDTHNYWLRIESYDDNKRQIHSRLITHNPGFIDNFEYLSKRYYVGAEINSVPIVKKDEKGIRVEIAPGFNAICFRSHNKIDNLSVGTLVNVDVMKIKNGDIKGFVVNLKKQMTIEERIIKNFKNNVYDKPVVPKKTVLYFKKNFFNDKSEVDIRNYILEQFDLELNNNRLIFNSYGSKITFNSGQKDKNGSIICVGAKFKKNENKYIFDFFGVSSAYAKHLIDIYAEINWNKALTDLAKLALSGEKWEFANDKPYYILSQYLRLTFYKAYIDGLIKENESKNISVFNTGLVDKNYDDIFCCFEKSFSSKYKLSYFFTKRNNEGQRISKNFIELPDSVEYIKKIDDVFFNKKLELKENLNLEHIVKQRLERFPYDFLVDVCYSDKEFREEYEKNLSASKYAFYEYIRSKDSLIRNINQSIIKAVDLAINRCKWNYKTAVPIYYVYTNGISLLLPLCLGDIETDADSLALVIEKNVVGKDANYLGKTILTLDMAYLDARQICRPDCEWLIPETINNEFDDDDEEEIDEN